MTYSDSEIAEAVGAPTNPFTPEKGALSTLFRWFADDSRLCVIAPDLGMKASSTDVGFAHALGHLGDRDLIVVFPRLAPRPFRIGSRSSRSPLGASR